MRIEVLLPGTSLHRASQVGYQNKNGIVEPASVLSGDSNQASSTHESGGGSFGRKHRAAK